MEPGQRVRLDFAPEVPEPPAPVPEPSSAFGLLALGLVGAVWQLKRDLQAKVGL